MSDFCTQYPEFINSDPRRVRVKPYTSDAATMERRHNLIFQNVDWSNKTVLDLGCCVGFTGAWALHNGASHYTGVEYFEELSTKASENLNHHFSGRYDVVNSSAEEFLLSDTREYDVVIALGVFTVFSDPVGLFNKALVRTRHAAYVESVHPTFFRNDKFSTADAESVRCIGFNTQAMINGDSSTDVNFSSTRPSMGLLKFLLEQNGFAASTSQNEEGKLQMPDLYSKSHRFIISGSRITRASLSALGMDESLKNNNYHITRW